MFKKKKSANSYPKFFSYVEEENAVRATGIYNLLVDLNVHDFPEKGVISYAELNRLVLILMDCLTSRETKVISQLYGLNGIKCTEEEIAYNPNFNGPHNIVDINSIKEKSFEKMKRNTTLKQIQSLFTTNR